MVFDPNLQNFHNGMSQYLNHREININRGASISPVGLTICTNGPENYWDGSFGVTTELARFMMYFPRNWIHSTINAENIKPFIHVNSKEAIIPVDCQGALLHHQEAIANQDWEFLNNLYQLGHRGHPQNILIERMNLGDRL